MQEERCEKQNVYITRTVLQRTRETDEAEGINIKCQQLQWEGCNAITPVELWKILTDERETRTAAIDHFFSTARTRNTCQRENNNNS